MMIDSMKTHAEGIMKHHFRFVLLFFALLLGIFYTRPAQAANVVVGDGTPASCNETTFDAAWTQLYNDLGGTLTFQCGAAPHTIGFYVVKSVDNIQITVDGGG